MRSILKSKLERNNNTDPLKLSIAILGVCLFLILLPPRIITLSAHWSSDESLWLHRSAQFFNALQSGEFEKTLIAHHPGVTTLWFAGMRLLLNGWRTQLSLENLAMARWFISFILSAGCATAFFLFWRLFTPGIAITAWGFLAVNPFLLAQTRRVHTDALATTFILLTVLLFLIFSIRELRTALCRHKRGYLIAAGITFGVACLSKSYSVILIPWFVFCMWIFRPTDLSWRDFLYNILVTCIYLFSYSFLTVLSLWPRFWHPLGVGISASMLVSILLLHHSLEKNRRVNYAVGLATLVLIAGACYAAQNFWIVLDRVGWALTTGHEVDNFFLGKIVADPGWLFYIFTLSIKTTPLVLPLAIGAILFLWQNRGHQDLSEYFKIAIAVGGVALLFTICLSLTSKKFDRYLLPAFPMLVVSQVSIDSYYEKWYAACHCHKSFQLESVMPAKRYPVRLDSEQRASLITLTTSGTASARKLTHARILLKADAGEFGPAFLDKAIKAALDVSLSTIQRVRKTFVLEGLEAALLPRKPSQVPRPRKFDGEKEAHLIALACSDPPEGHACWTLRLLAEKMVELEHFSSISHESIRQVLKKTNCVPGASSAGVSQQKLRKRL